MNHSTPHNYDVIISYDNKPDEVIHLLARNNVQALSTAVEISPNAKAVRLAAGRHGMW